MSRQSTICPPSPSDSEDDASMLETLPSETMVDLSSNEGEDENTSSTTRSQRSQSQKTGYRNARQLLSDSFSKDLSTRVDDDSSDNDDGDQQQRKKSVDLSTRVDDDSSDIDEDDRQPDKEGTPDFSDASSSSSEETDNDNDTQIGFRFVEGRDWDYYKDEPVLEIVRMLLLQEVIPSPSRDVSNDGNSVLIFLPLIPAMITLQFQSGIDMLTTLVANRSFRFRSAKTDHERSFGILDRIRIEFRPSTGKRKTQKRDLLIVSSSPP